MKIRVIRSVSTLDVIGFAAIEQGTTLYVWGVAGVCGEYVSERAAQPEDVERVKRLMDLAGTLKGLKSAEGLIFDCMRETSEVWDIVQKSGVNISALQREEGRIEQEMERIRANFK